MDYIKPNWPAPKNVFAFTTTKKGWGNAPYSRSIIAAQENQEIKNLLNLPNDPVWINQTHSTIALEATPYNRDQIADASFTKDVQQICVVTTADCLPVLITNQKGTKVAAIHAGWRGLAAGVIEETLMKMSLPPNEVVVWLGPAIGPDKFEVGVDVYEAFTKRHPESEAGFKPHREGKWLANLYSLAKIRLQQQGVTNVHGGDFCTYTQNDLFFSYRREGKQTGRMASLIWINSNT